MLRNNRVIFYHAGSHYDYSVALSDIHSGSKVLNFVNATDYLYLGSDFPFNHRYFDVSVVNAISSNLTVEIWSGANWVSVVDILDETNVNGISLAQSGIISWQVDLEESSWTRDDTHRMINQSALLAGFPKIYGLYWARLKWSTDLTVTTALANICHKFSEDSSLESEYPELASGAIKSAWKTGKTDWKEQTLMAAEYIIQDLRGIKDLITSPSQILDWKQFEKASVHKTAEIIFRGFGDDYNDQRQNAHIDYKKCLSVGKFNVDLDLDANLSDKEKCTSVRYATR